MTNKTTITVYKTTRNQIRSKADKADLDMIEYLKDEYE